MAAEVTLLKRPDIEWPGGRLALSQRVHIAGILNVTPDSFSDGGRFASVQDAADAAIQMVDDGADIIDVGGESTRPGSESVDPAEEMQRVVPVISAIRQGTTNPISIDTRKAAVARAALEAGADIVNDISALRDDPEMATLCASTGAPVILMHMKGTPRTMQQRPHYDDVVDEVRSFLGDAMERAEKAGVSRDRIILDPGIGFGKRQDDNLALVNRLDALAGFGRPIMMGGSRKSFIGRVLGTETNPIDVAERLEGSLSVAVISVMRGACLLRVHDVKEHVRAVRMTEAVLAAKGNE